MDLAVSDEYNFQVDDIQLFPPTMSLNTIHVTQVDPTSEEALRLRVTGFQLRFDGADTVSESGTELLPLTLQIASIEDVAVDLPELKINLLKDSEGRLMIASYDAAQPIEASHVDKAKECNEWPLYCKWKSILADKIETMKKAGKGCNKRPHGQGHGHGNIMEEETTSGKPPHRFRPGKPHHRPDGPFPHHQSDGPSPHHRPHGPPPHHMGPGGHHKGHGGHHHHHHAHGRVQAIFRRAFFTVLIPIVIGIFVGTVTYLVGMALGCLIAIIIAKFRGQSYHRIALEEDDEEAVEDAGLYAEKQEYAELPAYDDPPVYNEAEEKEVAEKDDVEAK